MLRCSLCRASVLHWLVLSLACSETFEWIQKLESSVHPRCWFCALGCLSFLSFLRMLGEWKQFDLSFWAKQCACVCGLRSWSPSSSSMCITQSLKWQLRVLLCHVRGGVWTPSVCVTNSNKTSSDWTHHFTVWTHLCSCACKRRACCFRIL